MSILPCILLKNIIAEMWKLPLGRHSYDLYGMLCCITAEEEKEAMASIFEFAKELITLKLTENELALICAVVLMDSGKYNGKYDPFILSCTNTRPHRQTMG